MHIIMFLKSRPHKWRPGICHSPHKFITIFISAFFLRTDTLAKWRLDFLHKADKKT